MSIRNEQAWDMQGLGIKPWEALGHYLVYPALGSRTIRYSTRPIVCGVREQR